MSTINVHEYPQDPKDLPAYRIAVMQAHLEGKKVEILDHSLVGFDEWLESPNPCWDWSCSSYRIAAPKIAKGNNPHGLTEEQVGVKDGWRLLEIREIGGRSSTTDEIEAWHKNEWDAGYAGYLVDVSYRTKKPEGYFLPKPEVPLAELDKQACSKSLRAFADGESMAAYTFKCGWMEALKYERSRAK